jgi:hypothetical protein
MAVLMLTWTPVQSQQEASFAAAPMVSSAYCARWTQAVVLPPANLRDSIILRFEDEYFALGCKHEGFTGYFAAGRWSAKMLNGDGGVDVTGAPNVVSVEGADSTRLKITNPGSEDLALRIVLPADGYLFFKLVKVGGSNFPSPTTTGFRLLVDDRPTEAHQLDDGSVYSPALRRGEDLTLILPAGASYQWSELTYICEAPGVIERTYYTPTSEIKQLISLEKASLTDIQLPQTTLGEQWPYLDRDGDPMTTNDQFPLNPDNDQFSLDWEDKEALRQGEPWVMRQWHIVDLCGQNEMRVQQWWQPLPDHLSAPDRSRNAAGFPK